VYNCSWAEHLMRCSEWNELGLALDLVSLDQYFFVLFLVVQPGIPNLM
jgi:hypothetical protein